MKRRLTFFAEDRLLKGPDGLVRGLDPVFASGGWARGLTTFDDIAVAARVGETTEAETVSSGHVVEGAVVALPYYHGVKQMALALPSTVRAIHAAVRDSDAIAVRLPGVIGLVAVFFALLHRRTIVVEMVGDIDDLLRGGVAGRVGRWLAPVARSVVALATKQADYVRYVTVESLQAKYPAARRAIDFNFSDVELVESDFVATGAAGGTTIVAAGSQEQPYKGHDMLIRAVAQLRSRKVPARLRLMGQGKVQGELRELAAELGVTEHVDFLGHVAPRASVMEEIDRCAVFAMPSRTEGLPRALLEAMARGKACIATRVGGIPELLDDEYLCAVDDQPALDALLARMLTDADWRGNAESQNRRRAHGLWETWNSERAGWNEMLRDVARA